MKQSDQSPKVVDEVIREVRSVKRAISERHGNDIDRLLTSLIAQEKAVGIVKEPEPPYGDRLSRT
jgi:hypothetical protein